MDSRSRRSDSRRGLTVSPERQPAWIHGLVFAYPVNVVLVAGGVESGMADPREVTA